MGTWENLIKSAESFLNEDDEAVLPQSEERGRRRRNRGEEGNGTEEHRGQVDAARDLESGGEYWDHRNDLESGAYYDGVRFLREKGDGGWLD